MILWNSLKQGRLYLNERYDHETKGGNDSAAKSAALLVGPESGLSRCHAARIIGQPRATLWQNAMQMPTKRVTWTLHLFGDWTKEWRESIGVCADRTNRHCQTSNRGIDSHRCCAGGNFGYQRRIIKAQGVGMNGYYHISKRNGDDYRQYGRSVSGGF